MHEQRPKIEERIFRQFGLAGLLLGIALLQTALAPTLWRFRVDWVLLVILSWTLLRGLLPGLRWALYGGLALDLMGAMPVGSHLLALLLSVCVVALITEPLDRTQPLLVLAVMLGATLLYGVTLTLILHIIGQTIPWGQYPLVVIVPTAIIDTIIAIPVFSLLRRFEQRGQPAFATELM
jgi:rod shape-determining protein MreD